ncbi:MAG: c-type cytochrome [Alphaproteobacteria bacterium]|nr:c-type cytochrome [Alphaproteobacteria bacterium]
MSTEEATMRMGTTARVRAGFVSVVLALIVIAATGFVALAQSSDRSAPRSWWDMWNPPWMQRDMWGRGQMDTDIRQRMSRHWTFMNQGAPTEYRGALNPYSADTETITEGRALYQQNCVRCHGKEGLADGEVGRALNPSPALLAYLIQMPMVVDEYLLWAVSDGGTAFGTAMPAFKDTLTEDQIWKIVTFMRSGFPPGIMEQ